MDTHIHENTKQFSLSSYSTVIFHCIVHVPASRSWLPCISNWP